MIIMIADSDYTRHQYDNPVRAEIKKRIYEPCKRAAVTVPVGEEVFDALDLRIMDDDGVTLFYGLADDSCVSMDGTGHYITVKARSLGALLEDNEAVPGEIPAEQSLMAYYDSRIKPYNIAYRDYMDPFIPYPVMIYKGTSEWSALCTYLWALRNTIPDVDEDNKVVFMPSLSTKVHVISNDADGALNFSELRWRDRPEERYSSVWAYNDSTGAYESTATDNGELARSHIRRTLLSLPRYVPPAKTARCQMELRKQRAGTRSCTVKLPGYHKILTWELANVVDKKFGSKYGLAVAEVKAVMDGTGVYTELELWPASDMI